MWYNLLVGEIYKLIGGYIMSISVEDGFKLVDKYVNIFIGKGQFLILLKNGDSVDDLVSLVNLKFIENGFYAKWDPLKAGKKYYVSMGVKRKLIDEVRTYKETLSLDQPKYSERTVSLLDMLKSTSNTSEGAIDRIKETELLMMVRTLPDKREGIEYIGESPVLGECRLSMKTVAVHLILGFNAPQIAKMFVNPHKDKCVSEPTIYNIRNDLRQYLMGMS